MTGLCFKRKYYVGKEKKKNKKGHKNGPKEGGEGRIDVKTMFTVTSTRVFVY